MIAAPSPSPRDRRAFAQLAELADRAHIRLGAGTSVLRTSSRFCLGIEHGDYNGTELFGVGTDRFLWLAWRPRSDGRCRLFSGNFASDGLVEIDHAAVPDAGQVSGWARYPCGVLDVLQHAGVPIEHGIDAVLHSDIPGGGMSRSASLCLNLILSLLSANGNVDALDRHRIARLAQQVENDYVGSPCGVLDQTMILFARAGHGTHFDPRTRRIEHVPLGASPAARDLRLLALDTGTVRPGLETSTYAVRRAECEELVRRAQQAGMAIETLAELRSPTDIRQLTDSLGGDHPHLLQRLAYLQAAQPRFQSMLNAWREGDVETVGAVFRADGHGLRDQYRISGQELETMCDLVRTVPGVYGERLLGGGDKGAAGALCDASAVPAIRAAVQTGYPRSHPEFADRFAVHELQLVDGVARFDSVFD